MSSPSALPPSAAQCSGPLPKKSSIDSRDASCGWPSRSRSAMRIDTSLAAAMCRAVMPPSMTVSTLAPKLRSRSTCEGTVYKYIYQDSLSYFRARG